MNCRHTLSKATCVAAVLSALLGSGCAALTEPKEAIIRVEASHNRDKAQRLTLAGIKAMNTGHIDHAFEKLMAAVAADERFGPAHNNLGLLHYDQGELYDAVLSFERATELMPNDPTTFYNLGLALEAAGRVHEALDLYWQAVEMDPTNPHYLGNLVRLRIRLGENSPEVISQLQDLVLIETRPDWRSWADRKLALDMNEMLDRGPEAPDFDSLNDADRRSGPSTAPDVIDLTPASNREPVTDFDGDDGTPVPPPPAPNPPLIESDQADNNAELPSPERSDVRDNIRDQGSLEILPPSIDVVPEPDPRF